jgi:hypothetical protein
MREPSLFDDFEGPPTPPAPVAAPVDNPLESALLAFARRVNPRPPRDVPHAVFLSWDRRQQLAYCAARDRYSAVEEPGQAAFFNDRAAGYERDLNHVKTDE